MYGFAKDFEESKNARIEQIVEGSTPIASKAIVPQN
jgi:hypothetical protein